jgi:hypothetical protein
MIERLRTSSVSRAKGTLFPDWNPLRIVREKSASKCLVSGEKMSTFAKNTHVEWHMDES